MKAGLYVSCMTWDRDLVVVGRGQSATYTAAETGHSTMISPLVFLYSRPGLEKVHSLYGHLKGVTCLALGRSVLVSGSLDWTVRVWSREEATQTNIINMQEHNI